MELLVLTGNMWVVDRKRNLFGVALLSLLLSCATRNNHNQKTIVVLHTRVIAHILTSKHYIFQLEGIKLNKQPTRIKNTFMC